MAIFLADYRTISNTKTALEPVGVTEGDLILALSIADDAALTAPAGWTQVSSTRNGGEYNSYANIWVHKRGASPPSLVWTGTGTSYEQISLYAYRGADDIDVADVSSVGSLVAPSLTATRDGSLLLAISADSNWTSPETAPAGMTLSDSTGAFTLSYQKVDAGATGERTYTAIFDASTVATWSVLITRDTPPTVALNSPADASSDSDTTPTLSFTGTDAQSEDISYQVQVDTTMMFGMIDSKTSDHGDGGGVYAWADDYFTQFGHSFTGNGNKIGSASLAVYREGSPTGSIIAKIYAHSGTFGVSSVPTGSALATSDSIDVSTIPTDPTNILNFTFSGSNQITLTNSTNYVVVFEFTSTYSGFSDSLRPKYYNDFEGGHAGNLIYNDDGSFYALEEEDLHFIITDISGGPLLDKLSDTDSGFSGTPDNTDPYASGQQVSYTVQAGDELDPGTYYWRVRGFDPNGSNTDGEWSSTRSFTISSASSTGNMLMMFQ